MENILIFFKAKDSHFFDWWMNYDNKIRIEWSNYLLICQ